MQGVAAGLVAVVLSLGGVTPGWFGHQIVTDKRLWQAAMERAQLKLEMLDDPGYQFQTFTIKETPEEHDDWLREVLADKVKSRAASATIRSVEPFGNFCRIEADTADGPLVLDYGPCKPRHKPGDKVEIFGRISPPPVGGTVDPHVLNPADLEPVGTIARLSAHPKPTRPAPKPAAAH